MDGTVSQWLDLGLYMTGMILLFSVIGLFSTYLTNKFINKNKLYRTKKKTPNKKKQWFYDVA